MLLRYKEQTVLRMLKTIFHERYYCYDVGTCSS